ncbi:MAG: helix-turn-helix domain-containing protein [Rubrivivax sp.]
MSRRPSAAQRPHQMYASSLANGLRLLASFSMEAPAMSNGELATRSGLSPASVTRLTYTLGELGYLRYDAAERRYRLGAATMTVGYPLLASLGVRQVAGPLMQALARKVRATVSLALRERTHMVYVETYRGHDGVAFRPEVGGRMPIWATAARRAWLAGAEAAHWRDRRGPDPPPACGGVDATVRR